MTTLDYHKDGENPTPFYFIIAQGGYEIGGDPEEYRALAMAICWSCNTNSPAMVSTPEGKCYWTVKLNSGLWTIEEEATQ